MRSDRILLFMCSALCVCLVVVVMEVLKARVAAYRCSNGAMVKTEAAAAPLTTLSRVENYKRR